MKAAATTTRSDKEINQRIKRSVGDLLAFGQAFGLRDVSGTTRKIKFCCPSHDDQNPSAGAEIKDGEPVWGCFVCGAGGDAFNLAAAAMNLDVKTNWPDVREVVARHVGINLPTRPSGREKAFVSPDLLVKPDDLLWIDNLLAAVARMDLVDPTEEVDDAPDTKAKPEDEDEPKTQAEPVVVAEPVVRTQDKLAAEDKAAAPAAPTPATHPARDVEYAQLWAQCLRLDDPLVPTEVLGYLRGRKIEPEWLLGCTPDQDDVRVLPRGIKLPSWAWGPGGSWIQTDHLLITRAQAPGRPYALVRARSIDPACPKSRRELAPKDGEAEGTAYACPLASLLLTNAQAVVESLQRRSEKLAVVLGEGSPDYWTLRAWARKQAPTGTRVAVLGIYSGGWTPALAGCIPAGTKVILRTHSDKGGCSYRDDISETLWARRCLVEVRHPDGIPTKQKLPDENDDLARFGLDSIDPIDGNTARPAPPRGGFPLTELGNAERLVHRHGADLRYCAKWGEWLAWDGSRWDARNPLEVERRAAAVSREIRVVEAPKVKSEEYREKVEVWSYRSESSKAQSAMVKLARAIREVEVRPDQLDADPWELTVCNGTINLRTGRLIPSSRAAMATKMAPVIYDPHAQCPQWLKFLDEIMGGNQALVGFLRRFIGYSLTGSTREHAFAILHGRGRNGKGTLVATIQAMLGDYSVTVDRGIIVDRAKTAHPTDFATLLGVRFAFTSEADEAAHLSHDTIKQIVSEDRIPARKMGKDWFEFPPTHKLWYAVNDVPRIKADDTALLARIKLIPFEQSYLGREDRELPGKLLAELPGILRWAVEGCLEWQRIGLAAPPEVVASVEKLRVANDDIGRFIDDECKVDPGARVTKKALYVAYKQWAAENGVQHPLSAKTFGARLDKKGFGEAKSNGVEYRLGLRLRVGDMADCFNPGQLDAAIAAIDKEASR